MNNALKFKKPNFKTVLQATRDKSSQSPSYLQYILLLIREKSKKKDKIDIRSDLQTVSGRPQLADRTVFLVIHSI